MTALTKFEIADIRGLEIARHYYEETKKPFVVSVGKFSGWDCQAADGTIRLEIKGEGTPARTGKVCIEYWNIHLNEPSGVLSTQANVWVHIIPEGDHFIAIEYDIQKLRKLVIETTEWNTNGHDSKFKLIPIDVFKANAKRTFRFESKFVNDVPNQL